MEGHDKVRSVHRTQVFVNSAFCQGGVGADGDHGIGRKNGSTTTTPLEKFFRDSLLISAKPTKGTRNVGGGAVAVAVDRSPPGGTKGRVVNKVELAVKATRHFPSGSFRVGADPDASALMLQRYLDFVLEEVRKDTGVAFFYSSGVVGSKNSVTVDLGVRSSASRQEVLSAAKSIPDFGNDEVRLSLLQGKVAKRMEEKERAEWEFKERLDREETEARKEIGEIEKKLEKVRRDMDGLTEGLKKSSKNSAWKKIKSSQQARELAEKMVDEKNTKEQMLEELRDAVARVIDRLNKLDPEEASFRDQLDDIQLLFGSEVACYRQSLPIYAFRSRIVESARNCDVTILVAETGSGKSSQVPKYLHLDHYVAKGSSIVCTQPRKVAASNLASYVSDGLGKSGGKQKKLVSADFGYKEDRVGVREPSSIVFTTDNALLQEWASDNLLSKYDCVIVDEAHERTLATDLLLSILKKTLVLRPLRIIITSATIDPATFRDYFKSFRVNVIGVPGKLYPVALEWRSHREQMNVKEDYLPGAVKKIVDIITQPDYDGGSVLVFVATLADTERGPRLLEERCEAAAGLFQKFQVLPLHGRLQPEEQQKVFDVASCRLPKIVFSTNVAETSVTVPGVTHVIDCGVAKERHFDPRSGASVLRLTAISKSSAKQRQGRAGRTAPGKCYRLYSEEDFETMREALEPEIQRLPLDQCLIMLFRLGVQSPLEYEFLDPPSPEAVRQSLDTLAHLEAIQPIEEKKSSYTLTWVGKKMSLFPMDPRLSRILVLALESDHGVVRDAIVLCAIMSNGGNVFFRQGSDEERNASDVRRIRFCDERGDFVTMLNVYNEWKKVDGGDRARSMWCVDNYVNGKSMRMIETGIKEIKGIAKHALKASPEALAEQKEGTPESLDRLFRMVTDSFFKNVAMYAGHPDQGYVTKEGDKLLVLHPSSSISALSGKPPTFVVFDSIFTTHRKHMMHVTAVDEDLSHLFETFPQLKLVKKLTIGPMGGFVQKAHFVGKKFVQLKLLEKDILELINPDGMEVTQSEFTDFIKLECDFKRGTLLAFSQEVFHPVVKATIMVKLDAVLEELKRDTMEVQFEKEAGLSLLIGEGGRVMTPLLPCDFIEICIKQPYVREAIENIVQSHLPYRQRLVFLEDGRCIVAFRTPTDAECGYEEFVQNLANLDLEENQVMKKRRNGRPGNARQAVFTVMLQLRRRQRTNFGFIEFTTTSKASTYVSLSGGRGTRWQAKISKKNAKQVFLTAMLPSDTEEEVRKTIKGIGIDEEAALAKVTLPCAKGFASAKAEITALEADMVRRLPGVMQTKKFQLRIPPNCQPGHVFWKVFIEFSDVRAGRLAGQELDALKPSFSDGVRSYPFDKTECTMNATLVVFQEVFQMLEEEAFAISPDLKCARPNRGRLLLSLRGNDVDQLSHEREALSELLGGTTLDAGGDVRFLFAGGEANRSKIRRVEREREVIVKKGVSVIGTPAATVFGKRRNVDKALDDLRRILTDILTSNSESSVIPLVGEGCRGLLKEVVREFGADLRKLIDMKGILEGKFYLRGRRRELHLRGSAEGLASVKDKIRSLKDYLDGNEATEEECCSTCFTEPEEADEYRFELCGHLSCKSCFKMQVMAAELPLMCPKENCEKEICVQDLKQVLLDEGGGEQGGAERMRQKFLLISLQHFISNCGGTFGYCPTPDCGSVFKRASKRGPDPDPFFCRGCKTDICTKCCVVYHEGLSCEAYKIINGENTALKRWFMSNPAMRKLCPKCSSGIEKIDGCDRMQCTVCRTVLCWRCRATFTAEVDVYQHLETCTG